ncbi:MAG TPA: tetratricopeptide repeat protein [Arenimonas sp.]|uniref:YfgM family protein n=1 Tax=Arenimonas sp. TaxID=1872635 RepID=UPI002D7F3E39|nr:tetratricopeptide repeat protein [Arenimonas sp.]HEU0153619.1 tetratricopeptide repeat protein [Arenimonas sp.]
MDQIDEYEQGERVRAWLRNNGSSLIGGVALGLACLAGWQWWQGQQANEKVQAAIEFRAFNKALDADEVAKAEAHATALAQDHPDTVYPALAALRRAEALHAEGKDDEAVAVLDTVARDGLDPMLFELAQLRAARLQLIAGKPAEALERLAAMTPAAPAAEADADADVPVVAFPSVAAEIRGDAEMALGRRDAARTAYEQALATLDLAAPTRSIVEMKLTDAGGSPAAQPEI